MCIRDRDESAAPRKVFNDHVAPDAVSSIVVSDLNFAALHVSTLMKATITTVKLSGSSHQLAAYIFVKRIGLRRIRISIGQL